MHKRLEMLYSKDGLNIQNVISLIKDLATIPQHLVQSNNRVHWYLGSGVVLDCIDS